MLWSKVSPLDLRLNFDTAALVRSKSGRSFEVKLATFCLMYFAKGTGILQLNGESFQIDAGSALLAVPNDFVVTRGTSQSVFVYYSINFAVEQLGVGEGVKLRLVVENVQDRVLVSRLWDMLIDFPVPTEEPEIEVRKMALLLILGLMNRAGFVNGKGESDRADNPVLQLARRIKAEPGKDWRLESMAASIGLSPSQLNRNFRAVYGIPPGKYVIEMRIAEAKRLLLETELRIGEIAHRLGYNDNYFFSRQFHQVVGLSPSEWKNGGPKC